MELTTRPVRMTRVKCSPRRDTIYAKTYGVCFYCGDGLDIETFHVDHFTPKAKGGSSRLENLVPACQPCNLSKNRYSLDEWRFWIGWKQASIPPFTPQQRQWLAAHGFTFPELPEVTFWFEREGMA